jgi:polyisoprenoid-binding protein YceI
MKKTTFILIACVFVIVSGFTVSMFWNVMNDGVTISFELPDEGTKGTLGGLKATIDFDQKDPANSKISASVDIKTLNTGNKQKDDHLLSADFFNAEKYPSVTFVSKSVKATDKGFLANGDLTMKDSTMSVEIPFVFVEGADGTGSFQGTMTIFSGDFGITKKSKSGKDKVVITLNVPVKK